jgi:uncharacterized protein YoxC
MEGVTLATLVILAICLLALLGVLLAAMPRVRELADELQNTLGSLQRALFQVEQLGSQLRQAGVVDKLNVALLGAQGAVGRIDPLAGQLSATLSDARDLLGDAKVTSQSVRARVDDLAAVQTELTALATALADVAAEIRDREVAKRLADVLADTSLLAADIGVLAENATSMLDSGKPLVSNLGSVVGDARRRASGIGSALGSLRAGLKAGVDTWKEGKPDKE